MQVLHQESEKAPLDALPLEAALHVLQAGGDGPVEHLDTHHVPGEGLKGGDLSQKTRVCGVHPSGEKSFKFTRRDNVSAT